MRSFQLSKTTKKEECETKNEAFKRLAEARTGNAIEQIIRIGNLANKRHYEYTDADVKKIITALKKTVAAVEAKFKENEIDGKRFSL